MKVAAFHFSQWFNSPCLPEGGSVKTWDDGRGRRRIDGGRTIHRIHRYFFGLDSLSLPPQLPKVVELIELDNVLSLSLLLSSLEAPLLSVSLEEVSIRCSQTFRCLRQSG